MRQPIISASSYDSFFFKKRLFSKKILFQVTIIHKNTYKSMSNMPLENKTPVASIPGYVKSEFQVTPTMSPYLLALVVHNLSSINASFKSIDGRIIPLTFYTEDILMRNAEIAVNMSVQIFTMYEEWFGIPYPMPKIDFFTTRQRPGSIANNLSPNT